LAKLYCSEKGTTPESGGGIRKPERSLRLDTLDAFSLLPFSSTPTIVQTGN